MGINARIDTELGAEVAGLQDPHNRVNWLLSLASLDSTVCLRFIDPYGNTVFNGLQTPVLHSELSSLELRLTDANLLESKRVYLDRAAMWPMHALREAHDGMKTLSLGELRHHLEVLLKLVSDAIDKGPHYYVRFIGD